MSKGDEFRLQYNNTFFDGQKWESDAQRILRERLRHKGFSQLFSPMAFNIQSGQTILDNDKVLSRIFANMVDSYDELPSRPEMAFDIAWRTLEIEVYYYAQSAWNHESRGTVNVMERIVDEVVVPLAMHESQLLYQLSQLLTYTPLSAISFMLKRYAYKSDILVGDQQPLIIERVNNALGEDVMGHILTQYDIPKKSEPKVLRDATLLIQKMLCGNAVDIGGKRITNSLNQRLKLLINGVLFSSRCYRFHGDMIPPSKSSKQDLITMKLFYFEFLTSYTIYLFVFSKYIAYHKLKPCFLLTQVANILQDNLQRFSKIFPKD